MPIVVFIIFNQRKNHGNFKIVPCRCIIFCIIIELVFICNTSFAIFAMTPHLQPWIQRDQIWPLEDDEFRKQNVPNLGSTSTVQSTMLLQ